MTRRLAWCVLALPLLAAAATRGDYVRQWSLVLPDPSAGAYRVVLAPEVYRSAQRADLADVDVLNADGASVPVALSSTDQPRPPQRIALPWFPLPAGQAAQAQDIAVISERGPDGSVRRVEAHVSAQPASDAPAWLLDASRVREPIVALDLAWANPAQPVDTLYRVEGSDNLRDWRVLQEQAPLLDLVRDGRRLLQARIPLDGSAKYLRLLPAGAKPLPALERVYAELATPVAGTPWQWRMLAHPKRTVAQGSTVFQFDLDGRFPIEQADVMLAGNGAGEWTLQSRDSDDAPWVTRAGPWLAYQVGGAQADRSPAQALGLVVRDRQWRLSSQSPVTGTPMLRLGYHPEALVFVSQGSSPFVLVAGSARAVRPTAPVTRLVDALRLQHGLQWQPATAQLGAPAPLAGSAALAPQRDWKSWLLWSVLVTGALVVAGFALTLLRRPTSGSP
jgi:hypothetical protein